MAAGKITTARGLTLDMGQLKLLSRKPLNSNVNMKDKIERQQRPVKQANVRGHIPSMHGVINTSQPINVVHQTVYAKEKPEPSIADFTGIVVDNSDGQIEEPNDANSALDTIIGDLEQMRKRDPKGDAKSRRAK